MKAVILAGGEGTRLRPLTYSTPKSLLPICNIPFLEHQLLLLKAHGISNATLLTGYLADAFDPFIVEMKAKGVTLEVSREAEPLGTCGAVRSILDQLDDTTIVFNGDVLTDLDLTALIDSHRSNKAALTLTLKPVSDASAYGLVPMDDHNRVQGFIEKPPAEIALQGGNINAGTYVIEPRILEDVPANQMWSFERQLFPKLVEDGEPVFGFVSTAYWLDIGTPDRYKQAHWDLISGLSSFRSPDADLTSIVLLPPSARIDHDARVGPRVSIGPATIIEAEAVVHESVLLNDVVVERNAHVEDSILGPQTRVRSGQRISGAITAAGQIV
ncbi:MAG: sugar phosphate nucleotidyltransferase [Actinomycetota bacterium]